MDSIDAIEGLGDLVRLPSGLEKLPQLVRHCTNAYLYIRRTRIIRFLRSLDQLLLDWDANKRELFEKHVSSPLGQEILAEYSDTVLLTGSRIVHATLAILYADIKDTEYSPFFKRLAVTALQGCNDHTLEVFLLLLDLPLMEKLQGPYPLRYLKSEDIARSSKLLQAADSEEQLLVIIMELERRGILLLDHVSTRWLGSDALHVMGIGQTTVAFAELFRKSNALLGTLNF